LFRFSTTVGAALLAFAALEARAQDVTGIPNAAINPGYSSLSLRTAFQPESGGRPSAFAQQYAYQRNFGERWTVIGAAQFGRRGAEDFHHQALQAIVQWQFAEAKDAGADGALGFVARVSGEDGVPTRFVLSPVGKWIIRADWEARALAAAVLETGDNARDGVGLATKAEITRRIGTLGRLGVQTADSFNTTASFGAWRDQSHQAGPVVKTLIGQHLMVTAVGLAGTSRAAPDAEVKLFLTWEM
jgi:hypothetical protein